VGEAVRPLPQLRGSGNLAAAASFYPPSPVLADESVRELDSNARFSAILAGLKTTAKRVTKSVAGGSLAPANRSVSAQIRRGSNGFRCP